MELTVLQIAHVCHDANTAYCRAIGDDSAMEWERSPHWQKDSAVAGVQAAMESDKSPAEMHALWMAKKASDGWTHGPVKDPDKRQHPCMVPYEQLPEEQRRKDALFLAIVKALGPQHG